MEIKINRDFVNKIKSIFSRVNSGDLLYMDSKELADYLEIDHDELFNLIKEEHEETIELKKTLLKTINVGMFKLTKNREKYLLSDEGIVTILIKLHPVSRKIIMEDVIMFERQVRNMMECDHSLRVPNIFSPSGGRR